MMERLLTPEEIDTLKASVKDLKSRLESLKEDLEAGMPVEQQIAAVEGGIRTAEHMLNKYGKAPAVRPKRR